MSFPLRIFLDFLNSSSVLEETIFCELTCCVYAFIQRFAFRRTLSKSEKYVEPGIFFASFLFFPIQVPRLYSFQLIASGLRPNGTPISRCSALTMPHFLQDVSPSKSVTHVCLPPTGQVEFEANSYEGCLCKINIENYVSIF